MLSFNLTSFTMLCLYFLGCRTRCFYSCLTCREHFQLRILKAGKSLCSFGELASDMFRIILTDRREKEEDFWYPLDEAISYGNKAFSVYMTSIFEHFIVWVHLCGLVCSMYQFLRLCVQVFFQLTCGILRNCICARCILVIDSAFRLIIERYFYN